MEEGSSASSEGGAAAASYLLLCSHRRLPPSDYPRHCLSGPSPALRPVSSPQFLPRGGSQSPPRLRTLAGTVGEGPEAAPVQRELSIPPECLELPQERQGGDGGDQFVGLDPGDLRL